MAEQHRAHNTVSKPVIADFLDELEWRGLLNQSTASGVDAQGRKHKELREHLADPVKHPRAAYVGYDPTADSLTIGNLVTIMLLVHFQRAGHRPVVVMGGGTGLIGDPSGKSAERQMLTEERVRANVESQRRIFGRVFENAAKVDGRMGGTGLGGTGQTRAVEQAATSNTALESRATTNQFFTPPLVNNIEWLGNLGFLEALRDIGKYFSVNEMIKKDSVRMRLEQRDQGISYTEFTYQLLQSYDYLVLFRDYAKYHLPLPVTMQMGGSDQFGNIVGGLDLIGSVGEKSRHEAPGTRHESKAYGLTCPLVTKADGGKFGKTESGAIWLTAPQPGEIGDTLKSRTTPYAYYQFWLNASDEDVIKFLKIFTLLPKDRIEAIKAEHAKDTARRHAQRELARAATLILHGEEGVKEAEGATAALFGGKRIDGEGSAGNLRDLSLEALTQAFAAAPTTQHARALLNGPDGLALTELLPHTSLAKSKTEARTALTEGSISINGETLSKDLALARKLSPADLLHGQVIALRRGKKNWHITRWA
jgi:tyrosyl-tRNA synthetase